MALSVLFAVIGAWYLAVLVRPRPRGVAGYGESVGAGLHVLMSAAVIVMFWPWGERFPAIAQVTVFTAAAAWFAGQALFGGDALRARCANWYHAATMAAVAWIAVAMSAPATAVTAVAATAGSGSMSADMGGMDMSGMDMGGMDMGGMDMGGMDMGGMDMGGAASASPGTGIAGGPGTATTMAIGWAGPVCLVLAAGFFAIAAWYAFAALRPLATPGARNPSGTLSRDLASALIAVGLAVSLLEMA